jgi:hypothetical protein
LLTTLTGCTTISGDYNPPKTYSFANTKTVNKPFDAVWDEMVKNLSSDFFVINNIDKNSKIINVSFSTTTPSEYVDCGVAHITFKNARGSNTSSFNKADSTQQRIKNGILTSTTRLDGRVNIYISQENNATTIAVNAKYAIPVSLVFKPFGEYPQQYENKQIDLSTKNIYSNNTNTNTCAANGLLERRILNLVK